MARNKVAKPRDGRFADATCGVKFTGDQMERIQALVDMFPRLNKSDVIRALVEIALPIAEARPAALFEPVGAPKAQSA